MTGQLELTIAVALQLDGIDGVDQVLATTIERIGDFEVSVPLVRELCVADRSFVLLRVAALLRGRRVRTSGRCPSCATAIELDVDLEQLPVTPAGPGYPTCERQMAGRRVRLRVPTGVDLRASASVDPQQARLDLLDRCAEPIDGEGDLHTRLFDAIERAIEQIEASVSTTIHAICSACRREQSITLDPIAFARPARGELGLIGEIHMLAFHYHWSEADILALPHARRRLYLQQIERELSGSLRGTVASQEVGFERAVTLEIDPDVPRPRTTPTDLRDRPERRPGSSTLQRLRSVDYARKICNLARVAWQILRWRRGSRTRYLNLMSEAKMGHQVLQCPQFSDPMAILREQMKALVSTIEDVRNELAATKQELERANAELKRNLVDGTLKVAVATKADSATAARSAGQAKVAAKAHSATMLEADAGHYLWFRQLTTESRRAFDLFRWDGEWFPLVEVASASSRY